MFFFVGGPQCPLGGGSNCPFVEWGHSVLLWRTVSVSLGGGGVKRGEGAQLEQYRPHPLLVSS